MAAPLLIAAALAAAIPWGRAPVARVEVQAPARDQARVRELFAVRPDEILSRTEIRSGVQALIASGEVEDVAVDLDLSGTGVTLVVRVQMVSRVSSLVLSGLPRPLRRRVADLLGLERGAPLKVERFTADLRLAEQWVRSQGYPVARLDPDLAFDTRAGTVAVGVAAELGPPRTAAVLEAPGSELTSGQVLAVCRLEPGARLTDNELDRARRRLAEHLRREGYWSAEVDAPRVVRRPRGDAIVFDVRKGRPYRLELTGLERTKAVETEALPFLSGSEPFEDAALGSFLRRMEVYLQDDGMLLAQVHGEVVSEDAGEVLRISVSETRRTPIRAVRFPGLEGVAPDLLRSRIGVRQGRPWRWGGEPVDADSLAADQASILATLREEGYADAQVSDARIVAEDGGVAVEFPVTMGSQYLVESVRVEGVPEGVGLPSLSLRKGSGWSRGAQQEDAAAVQRTLEAAGYLDARVTAAEECPQKQCTIVIGAQPGLRVNLGRVVIAGLVRTRRSVVEKVLGLETGAPLGTDEQLEAQRRLLSLGVFKSVQLRPIPGQARGPRRGVVVDVEEGPTRSIGFGLGWDTEAKGRVSVSWSQLNLFGTGRGLFFDGSYSSRERRFQLTYREPKPLGLLGFPTWVSVYRTEENFDTFSVLQRGMWLELGDRTKRPGRALLRYDYQIVNPDAPPDILSTLERERQRLAIASLTPIVTWDSRDDIFTPHHGLYANAELQEAFRVFAADAEFLKLTASVAGFSPVAGGVLAGSVRAGAIEPRGPSEPGTPDNLRLPINVRFFAGGQISQRAFALDKLGIPGRTLDANGNAIGGAGLLLASIEWRFPLLGPVDGDLFVDGGNVWEAWRRIDIPEMRWGAGVGLRVDTPVGPIRLEYGWKLDRLPGESPGELFLSLGNPF